MERKESSLETQLTSVYQGAVLSLILDVLIVTKYDILLYHW